MLSEMCNLIVLKMETFLPPSVQKIKISSFFSITNDLFNFTGI